MLLKLYTIGQTLIWDNPGIKPVAYSEDYLEAQFTVPEDYDGTLTAHFGRIQDGVYVEPSGITIPRDSMTVPVPPEVIRSGKLYIWIDSTGDKYISTSRAEVPIGVSGNSGTIPETPEGNTNQYQEIIDMYNSVSETAPLVQANAAAVELSEAYAYNSELNAKASETASKASEDVVKAIEISLSGTVADAEQATLEANTARDNANEAAANAQEAAENLETTYAPRLTGVEDQLAEKVNQSDIANLASATPVIVSSTASMTDTAKIYVLGSTMEIYQWVSGAITPTGKYYNETVFADKSVAKVKLGQSLQDFFNEAKSYTELVKSYTATNSAVTPSKRSWYGLGTAFKTLPTFSAIGIVFSVDNTASNKTYTLEIRDYNNFNTVLYTATGYKAETGKRTVIFDFGEDIVLQNAYVALYTDDGQLTYMTTGYSVYADVDKAKYNIATSGGNWAAMSGSFGSYFLPCLFYSTNYVDGYKNLKTDMGTTKSNVTTLQNAIITPDAALSLPSKMYLPINTNIDFFAYGMIYTKGNYDDYVVRSSIANRNYKDRVRIVGDTSVAGATHGNTTTVTFNLYRKADLKLLDTKSVSVTWYDFSLLSNPSTIKNIAQFGDSLSAMQTGLITNTIAENITSKGFTNLKLIGKYGSGNNKYTANAGYAWNNYTDSPATLPSSYGYNWLWNNAVSDIDFNYFLTTYGEGATSLDCVICLIGWNHLVNPSNFSSDLTLIRTKVEYFLSKLHAQFPGCKVVLVSPQYTYPYDRNDAWNRRDYTLDYFNGFIKDLHELYKSIADNATYSGYVYFVSSKTMFDSKNNMMLADATVNARSTATYKVCTDTVHPDTSGYLQYGDIEFYQLCGLLLLT